MHGV